MHLIIFDTQIDIIESVQETVLINDDDLDLIHNDSDIEIGHNVNTSSAQCRKSTLSPLTNTEIAINLLCDKDIDDDDDDDDYEDECYDFQDGLFNFEQILRMSRDN